MNLDIILEKASKYEREGNKELAEHFFKLAEKFEEAKTKIKNNMIEWQKNRR